MRDRILQMGNLFDSASMAAGYAQARPPLHPRIIERIRAYLGLESPVFLALDIGCGAGLSTAPLKQLADFSVGLEPSKAMLSRNRLDSSSACFVAGRAELLPFRSNSVDLATAAGSLNWADLDLFFPELLRVLKPRGRLVVYDFGAGRSFRESDRLSTWFAEFERRFPTPPCTEISPQTLRGGAHGIRVLDHEFFDIGLVLTPEFYLEYVLTEINVAEAIKAGQLADGIREWCEKTLRPVFDGVPQEVLFSGFIVYLSPLV